MLIASWNVNSLAARRAHFFAWLEQCQPDVALLQELKGQEESFPFQELSALGYHAVVSGQKSYNGVAIIARTPVQLVTRTLLAYERTEDAPPQARYIEGITSGVRVASVYVPNGQSLTSDKFVYKLRFYDDLRRYLAGRAADRQPFILGGDFNVAHQPLDVWAPDRMRGDVSFTDQERQALRRLFHDGLYDTFRQQHPQRQQYSWWDYRAGSFQRNAGWRIDYLLANAAAMQCVTETGIDDHWRTLDKPSDHTPVWCKLKPLPLQ